MMQRLKVPRLLDRLVVFGTLWGVIVLVAATIFARSAENQTLLCSIVCSGIYTLILYTTRRHWPLHLSRRPFRSAVLLGIFNAAVVETIFLVFEHLFGAAGVAAHPNLIIDLLLTMPWYILMVCTFVHVTQRRRFSTATVLLLGTIYELGADGLVGPLVGLVFGDAQILDPVYWFLLGSIAFWQFIPVYSSILLPPSWVMNTTAHTTRAAGPAWRDAARPPLWLFPVMGYVLVFIILLGFFMPY